MASTSQDQHLQGSIVPMQRAPRPMEPGVTIGHVHLRTADIDRIRAFYVDLMGFDVVMEARDVPGWGTTGDILFLAAGGYHHHLGTNTWAAGSPPAGAEDAKLLEWELVLPAESDVAAATESLKTAGYGATANGPDRLIADPWGTVLRLRRATS